MITPRVPQAVLPGRIYLEIPGMQEDGSIWLDPTDEYQKIGYFTIR